MLKNLTRCALGPALCLFSALLQAAPYLPTDGAQVLEVLPRRSDPVQQQLQRMRASLSANPHDLKQATALAQRYIALARSASDPRYLGHAEAALAPWWRQAAPPLAVRILRATLLQSNHHFDAALADLDAVIAQEPNQAQAWLTRATVLTVQGDYARATASCARLSSLATELVAITCLASVASVSGRALQSEQLLDLTLRRSSGVDPEIELWVLTLLAEMAARRGDAPAAEARYQSALAVNPRDAYLLGAYADFLLDVQRPEAVLELLREQQRIDALLLRYALALQQTTPAQPALKQTTPAQPTLKQTTPAQPALAKAKAELLDRFNAAMQRGDTVHQREQAVFELLLRGDAQRALVLAQKNWAVQKEAADLRIYLAAALKAGDSAAAAPALQWIKTSHIEDSAVARLAQALMQQQRQTLAQARKKAGT